MITRGEILRCSLCSKVIAVNDVDEPLKQGRIGEEELKKAWMPNEYTHVCIACKRKYVRGGGVAGDCRKEGKS